MVSSRFIDLASDIVPPGPMLAFADNTPIVAPAADPVAVEHWRFGGSSASRAGQVNGLALRLGLAQIAITTGAGYAAAPAVALTGAGAIGLTGFAEISGGGVYSVGITGQPQDDGSAVVATLTGGGFTTAATVTMGRGAEPAYNDHSMVIAAGRVNGLISPINDAAVYTELFLIKRPDLGTGQRIGGSVMYTGGSRGAAVGGDGYAWATTNVLQVNGSGLADDTFAPPATWLTGTWGVLAVSQSATTRLAMAFGPDAASTKVSRKGAKTVANPMRKRALGGLHYDFGNAYTALEISEWANYNVALAEGQIAAKALDMLDSARINGLI